MPDDMDAWPDEDRDRDAWPDDDDDDDDDGAGDPPKSLRCIYKPIRGERPLDDFPPRTLAKRERAAYLLSEATGWGIVPLTLLRDGPFGEGAVQMWMDIDEQVDVVELVIGADPRLRPMAIFDAIANNADRKGGHLLPLPDGRIMGVDHGICFSADDKLRTVLWSWRGEPLTDDELEVVRRVCGDLEGGLGVSLGKLLSRAEVAATQRRAAALAEDGHFPQPDPYRPALPWPPF